MRIKSFRRERYPFCARRFLRKIKETEREIDGPLDRSLLFWFAFEPQWVYAVPLLVAIEFHVRSLSSSLSCSSLMFAPKQNTVRLESNGFLLHAFTIF